MKNLCQDMESPLGGVKSSSLLEASFSAAPPRGRSNR